MSAGRIVLIMSGIVFFVIGYVGLFPENALRLLADLKLAYTVGFAADPKGWHALGAAGGAAAVAGIWALSSAFRKTA